MSTSKLVRFIEGLLVAGLGQVPALLSSKAAQDFITTHPADAALIPVAAGFANVIFHLVKARSSTPKPPPLPQPHAPVTKP